MDTEAQRSLYALAHAGALLSNCAFNLAQHGGRVLTDDEARSLDECRRAWDAASLLLPSLRVALSAPPAPPPGPRTDAERLDWLGSDQRSYHEVQRIGSAIYEGIDPRAAIDAAMDGRRIAAERAP